MSGNNLNLRPPDSGRSARQLYGSLQKAINEGEMGSKDLAQEILEFAVIIAKKGTLEKGPAFEVFVGSNVQGMGLTPTWPPGHVVVQEVTPESWAERKGITVGCEIVAVNDKPVEPMERKQFIDLLKNVRPLRMAMHAPRDEYKDTLHQYAGILLDSLSAYRNSSTLDIWIVEALMHIHRFVGDHRDQMALPLFDAFSMVALRNATLTEEPELHDRVIVGLASMMNPECRFTRALIDFVLDVLQSRGGRLSPHTSEHALALLGCARSAHRLHHQIEIILQATRGFSSEASLATRALLTLAELYDLVAQRAANQPADDWYSSTLGLGRRQADELDAESVYRDGVPADGSDVRLAVTLLDLHKDNRKVAGAATRALSTMCKLTSDHLGFVLIDEPRGMLQAQQYHTSSRAVNLHSAEIVLFAAHRRGPSLLTESTVLLASRALRAFPRDGSVVFTGLKALVLTANKGELNDAVIESVPPTELVRIGEAHAANAKLMTHLCELLLFQMKVRPNLQDEFVRSGAVAVPFRVIDCATRESKLKEVIEETDIELAALAGRLILRLTFGNEDAMHHAAKLDGASALLGLLAMHEGNASVTHAALMALKNITHSQACRRLVIRYEDPESWSVLDEVLQYAEASTSNDPDVLAQALCALSTLTQVEGHEPSEDDMRVQIDQDIMRRMIQIARSNSSFRGDETYCLRLIAVAATEPHDQRLLDEHGNEIFTIADGDQSRVAAWAEPMEDDEDPYEFMELASKTEPEVKEKIRGVRGRVKMADMSCQTDPVDLDSLGDQSTAASSARDKDQPRRASDMSSDRPSTPLGEDSGWAAGLFPDEPGSDEESVDHWGNLLGGAGSDEGSVDIQKEINRLMGNEESGESENEKLANLPRRRRRHHAAHAFDKTSVKKIGKGQDKKDEGGIFGGFSVFGGGAEGGDAGKAAETKETGGEAEASYFSGIASYFGAEDATQAEGAEEDENGDGEGKADEGFFGFGGFGLGDEDEDEEAAEARKKADEEKKKQEEEEAAKKTVRFGGMFG